MRQQQQQHVDRNQQMWQQQQQEIRLAGSLLPQLRASVSLDRGCSSTKIVFVRRSPDDAEFSIVCCLAPNDDLDGALLWLRAEIEKLPEVGDGDSRRRRVVAVTGGGGGVYRQRIAQLLEAEAVYADELLGQSRGVAWLLRHARQRDIFYDDQFLAPLTEEVRLPALFVFSGSGNGLVLVYPDGSMCQDHIMMHGGKSFAGYGAMLVGSGNYDEIVALAERGDRAKVLATDRTFALPPEQLAELSREDRALALVQWLSQWVAYFVHHGICTSGVTSVLLGCNFWRGRVLRELFVRNLLARMRDAQQRESVRVRAFKIGHTGAVGSLLLSDNEDPSRWLRDDGFSLGD